jgi:hypothetical protein
MVRQQSETPSLSRALHETLDVLCSVPVRNAIIHDALRAAGLKRIPKDLGGMRRFMDGALRATAISALGPELAASVADEIERIVFRAEAVPLTEESPGSRLPNNRSSRPPAAPWRSLTPQPVSRRGLTSHPAPHSGVRRQGPSARTPTPPTSPSDYFRRIVAKHDAQREAANAASPEGGARVFVATADAGLISTFSKWLEGHAQVTVVQGIFELLRELDALRFRALVVIDCRQPTIRPAAIAALADELGTVDVVLCRSTPSVDIAIRAVSGGVDRWVRFDERAELDAVAACCIELVS